MKLSVSLSEEDVAFLDAYAYEQGFPSRSAVLHKAVRLLRAARLAPEYEGAWQEWAQTDDAALWDAASAEGLPG